MDKQLSHAAEKLMNGNRIPVLDGVRGIAILMVLVFHSIPLKGGSLLSTALIPLVKPMWSGVDLFFVLSGFLITGILLDTKQQDGYFQKFYVRRVLRIFPLYYGILLGLFVLIPLVAWLGNLTILDNLMASEYYSASAEKQHWLWLYLHNFVQATGEHMYPGFGHFWSLAIEEQFYMLWPLIVFFLPVGQLRKLCIAVAVLTLALRFGMLHFGYSTWAIRHITFCRIDTLVLGGLVAIILREEGLEKWQRAWSWIAGVSGLILVGMMFIDPRLDRNAWYVCTVGYTACALLFSALMFFVVLKQVPGWVTSILESSTLSTLGKYSYGIYVFHWPLVHAVKAVSNRLVGPTNGNPLMEIGQFVAITIVSLIVAWFSWILFESHWLKLKKYVAYNRASETVAS